MKNTRLIKCIQVIDNIKNGYGGFASVQQGGINRNSTQIRLTSQPGGKINSTVTIFTYKNPNTPSQYKQPAYGWKMRSNPNYYQNQIPGPIRKHQSHEPHKPYYPWPNLHKKK